MKQICFVLFCGLCIGAGCRKHHTDPCAGQQMPRAEFKILEVLSDTAFEADTFFRDNFVRFQSTATYDSVQWRLGSDPRTFRQPEFGLSFYGTLGTVPVNFTGFRKPQNNCFPGDNGIYTGTRNITSAEQVDKQFITLSPLIGRYKGSFTNNPADTFTVRFEYFDSAKYDVIMTGSKNFYWLSNFPKGFIGTSTPAYVYPELQYGRDVEMGYKCFEFGTRSEVPDGWCRGWLSNDTLTILSSGNTVPLRKFIGKRI